MDIPMNQSHCRNHLLASLPPVVYDAWQADFERVQLQQGQVLNEPGQRITHVYFPLTAIVSWVYMLENGSSTEIAMAGREGCVGMHFLLGSTTPNQAVVQTTGGAIRIRADLVRQSFHSDAVVQTLFLRFTQSLLTQIGLGAVCRSHHTVDQQLSRLVLMVLDRQDSAHLYMTHESLSQLLGVRREAVSLAAARLMKAGLIRYVRGHISVLDRSGLAGSSCECYSVLQLPESPAQTHPCLPSSPAHIKLPPSDAGWRSGSSRPPCAGLLCA
jgi:CRP-like cAMP-binding protein